MKFVNSEEQYAHVIYGLRDPLTGAIRYIGRSFYEQARLGTHISTARSGRPGGKNEWIRGLLSKGLKPSVVILYTVKGKENGKKKEHAAILEHKTKCDLFNEQLIDAARCEDDTEDYSPAERRKLRFGSVGMDKNIYALLTSASKEASRSRASFLLLLFTQRFIGA